jgi:spore maturation protein CgeB
VLFRSCRACEKLGHEVLPLVLPEFKEANAYWKVRAAKLGLSFIEENFFCTINQSFIDQAEKFKPDICIVMNGKGIQPFFLNFLREQKIKSILYMSDSIQSGGFNKYFTNLPLYDRIFSYEPSDTSFNSNIQYVFLGYDEEIFYPNPITTEKEIDISFVGLLDADRMKVLEKVAQYADKANKRFIVHTNPLFGKQDVLHLLRDTLRKRKFISQYPFLYNVLIDTPVYGKDLAEVYRNSKICINIHRDSRIHSGINPRTLEILGCRSFQMVDYGHLDRVELTSGKHISEFEDETDLCGKIDYFLKNRQERELIAAAGHQLAKQKYTMSECVKIMIDNL